MIFFLIAPVKCKTKHVSMSCLIEFRQDATSDSFITCPASLDPPSEPRLGEWRPSFQTSQVCGIVPPSNVNLEQAFWNQKRSSYCLFSPFRFLLGKFPITLKCSLFFRVVVLIKRFSAIRYFCSPILRIPSNAENSTLSPPIIYPCTSSQYFVFGYSWVLKPCFPYRAQPRKY